AARSWMPFMTGDPGTEAAAPGSFPYLRRRGPLALVALSTGLPTAPLMASGTLGKEQTERLAALLTELQQEGLVRVVLIHHPPLGSRPHHKRLTDAAALLSVLARHGAELVLHGHDHRQTLNWHAAVHGPIPVIGVPSCSAAPGSAEDDPAAYNLYRIDGESGRWRCEMVVRGLRQGGIVELERRQLTA